MFIQGEQKDPMHLQEV